jgi:hypothetical protein
MANAGSGSIASSQYSKAVGSNAGYKTHYARGRPKQTVSKKEKKMGFFRRKFNQWVRDSWNEAHNDKSEAITRSSESVSAKSSVRFTIYPASGGYVIEHYKQDRYKDSEGPELTIVNNGDNIGTTVEHILTMEALKS